MINIRHLSEYAITHTYVAMHMLFSTSGKPQVSSSFRVNHFLLAVAFARSKYVHRHFILRVIHASPPKIPSSLKNLVRHIENNIAITTAMFVLDCFVYDYCNRGTGTPLQLSCNYMSSRAISAVQCSAVECSPVRCDAVQ